LPGPLNPTTGQAIGKREVKEGGDGEGEVSDIWASHCGKRGKMRARVCRDVRGVVECLAVLQASPVFVSCVSHLGTRKRVA
jgi:hypothetical protein